MHHGNAAEQIRAEERPARPPGREDDDGEGDPAPSGGHILDPQRRLDEGQVGAADSGAGAAENQRQHPDAGHVVADGVGGVVVLADGAQDHAGACPGKEPGDPGDQQDRQVNQGIMREQQRPDDRDIGQHGDVNFGQRRRRLAGIGLPPKGRQAQSEYGQRQTRRHLIGHQHLGQKTEQKGGDGTGESGGEDTEKKRIIVQRRRESGDGADDHHPLDAQIEDTGALDYQFANGGEDQWRRRDNDPLKN